MTHDSPLDHSPTSLSRRVAATCLALLLCAFCLAVPAAPAHADAGRYLSSDSYAEVIAELRTLQSSPGEAPRTLNAQQQQRLADLTALRTAIAASDDRAQIRNASHHSVGVFARYKKEPASTPASFYVLGPGHETDDDFELVGLYVPAGVRLEWGDGGGSAASTATPRVARVLEGQKVRLTDGVTPAAAVSAPAAPASAPPAARTTYGTSGSSTKNLPSAASPLSSSAAPRAAQASTAPEAVTYALNLPVFSLDTRSEAVAPLLALSQAELDSHPETAPLD
jgi:hypothetical protein